MPALDKRVMAVALLWLVILLGIIAFKQYTIATGTEVLLKTRPVDPRDFFRGDYVALRYDINDLNFDSISGLELLYGETVYVTLAKSDKYYNSVSVSRERPNEGVFIKGKVQSSYENSAGVLYGIEDYFIEEGTGANLTSGSFDVLVSVDDYGNSVVRQLFVDGQSFK